MANFKEKFKVAVPVALASVAPVAVFAEEGNSMTTLTTGLVTGFQSIVSDMLSVLGQIIPVVLPVLGAVLVIRIGIQQFKSVSKGRG